MERIIRAEAAAMRMTLASLLADVRGPAGPPRRGNTDAAGARVAERGALGVVRPGRIAPQGGREGRLGGGWDAG